MDAQMPQELLEQVKLWLSPDRVPRIGRMLARGSQYTRSLRVRCGQIVVGWWPARALSRAAWCTLRQRDGTPNVDTTGSHHGVKDAAPVRLPREAPPVRTLLLACR